MVGERVLLVEGPDDEHVVKNICGRRQLGTIDIIKQHGGKDQLLESLATWLKRSDISVLGIILDADTDLQSRWQAITSRLRKAGYTLPETPSPDGTVIHSPANSILPRVGIWLMPNNQLPGILEDFLRFLVPTDDPLLGHVERSLSSIPPDQCRFNDLKRPKARIHTWLAWQEEPGKPLGLAISSRYFDLELPAGITFADWITRTFFSLQPNQ